MWLKRLIVLILVLNIVGAVALVPLHGSLLGIGHMVVLDRFVMLDRAGIIDWEKANAFNNGKLSGDWAKVPEYLLGGCFEGAMDLAWGAAIILVLNSIACICVLGRLRKIPATKTIDKDFRR